MSLSSELKKLADPKIAEHSLRFFKTGPGEYGYGDIFLGLRMPVIRQVIKNYLDLPVEKIIRVSQSKYHEERMAGLLLLVQKYKRCKDNKEKEHLYKTYVSLFRYINNWDLVDVTCSHIVGQHLLNRSRKPLYGWAKSKHLWTRRISIVSTFAFIAQGELQVTYDLADILLFDDHDLIHKAVGWALRETGKKNLKSLELFLKTRYNSMPRTMLRYSIEKLPESRRKKYLKGEI